MVKAIVLDIDGTLLTSNKEISEKTKVALIKAQEKGIKVILASGRPTSGMIKHVEALKMNEYEGFIVSFNGSCVVDCKTKEVLFDQPIAKMDAKKVLEHMKNFDVIPMICKDNYMYVNDVYNHILHLADGDFNIIGYEARGGNYLLCEKEDLADFVDFPLNKILIAGEADYLQEHYQAMKAPFADRLSGVFSAPFYFEFTDRGIDKAKALNTVLPNYGIEAQEVIAFGDGHNDQSIVEFAGIGVAMGNAVPELKAVADEITLSNDEDGIVKMLQKYL